MREPGRSRWPSPSVAVAAVGLVLLHTWILVESLEGTRLAHGRLMLTSSGKLALWLFWLVTLSLAALALCPCRDGGKPDVRRQTPSSTRKQP